MLIVAVLIGFSALVWWASRRDGRWREVLAFAAAPLIPCLVLASLQGDLRWTIVLLPFSYFFVILSVPAYLFLRHRGWIGLWQLLLVGTTLGALVCVAIGQGAITMRSAALYGGVGTLTALVFWLIAFLHLRPNKAFERTREG